MYGISIIVCCYNSARRLPKTIEHLLNQQVSASTNLEIIIINNKSSDNTFQIANTLKAENNKDNIHFKVLNEDKPGLNNARLKGIVNSTHEYVLFCDDDNWLDANYVELAISIMNKNPKIGVLGGVSEPIGESELPIWFTTYQHMYAVGVQSLHSGDVTKRLNLWGAGMVLRKSVFLKLQTSGFEFQLLDRNGSNIEGGGDSEICRWFVIAGYSLWSDENLKFKHFISTNRLQKKYIEKLLLENEASSKKLMYYDAFIRFGMTKKTPKDILKITFYFVKYLITKDLYLKACACSLIPLFAINKFDSLYSSIKMASIRYSKN